MSAALGWIGDLAKFIADWIPRPVLCSVRHAMIRHGKVIPCRETPRRFAILGAGLHWWWPALQDMEVYPVKRQVLKVPLPPLMTEDQEPVSGVVVLTYDIEDVEKYGIDHQDADDDLGEACFASGRDRIRSCQLEELAELDVDQQDEELHQELAKDLKPMGVRVLKACMGVAPSSVHHIAGLDLSQFQGSEDE